VASALTGASTEPKTGSCVMARSGPDLALHLPHRTDDQMDDRFEADLIPELIPIARCRELLGDEARELSDKDVDVIRKHARAMAHLLVEIFEQQQGRPPG
jgi:hypothetical protein